MIFRDRCFWSLILSLLLISVFGAVKPEPLDPLVASRDARNWFWANKVHNSKTYNLILLGDSRLYRGVSPAAMKDVLGQDYRILNFGFSSGGLNPRIFREAENRFAKDGSDKTVVMAVTPYSLTVDAAKNKHFLQEFTRPKEMVLQYLSYNSFLGFFNSVSPNMLRKKILGKERKPRIYYYQEFFPDGWVASYTVPKDEERALKSYTETFSKYQVDWKLINELCEQTQEWSQKGIMVFAFRPPVPEKMLALENELSGFNQHLFVEKFEKSGGVWVSIDHSDYETYDGSHLLRGSAVKLSHELAEKLSKYQLRTALKGD